MSLPPMRQPLSAAALVSLSYLGAGILWILLSDQIGPLLFRDPVSLTWFQTYKGWLFVCVTAGLFYAALRRFGRPYAATAAVGQAGKEERYSLQWLLTLLVLATAVPLVVLLAYNFRREAEVETEKAQLLVRNLADITATDTAATLAGLERLLAYLAALPEVRAMDPVQCGARFADVVALHPPLVNAATSNARGDVICSVLKQAGGARPNIAGSPWFAELKRRHALVISTPQKGLFTGRWVVVLSYPVRDAAGVFSGSVGVVADLAAFQPVVTAALPKGGMSGIVDSDSNVIARSFRPEELVGASLRDQRVTQLVLERKEGIVIGAGVDGVQRLYAFKPIGTSGWFAVAGVPIDTLYAEGREAIWRNMLVGLAILLLSAFLVLVIHRKIALPMVALTTAAEKIAGGEFDARVPEIGPREVARVAAGFNHALDLMRDSEARFRALTSLASDWYWETDAQHRFTLRSAGVHAGELDVSELARFIGKTRWELGELATGDAELQRHREQLERREPFRDFEFARRDASGKMRYALISGEPVFDASGAFTGYRGVGHSITARREAESGLRRSEQHYRTLFDASPDAIRVICEDRVVMLNPAGQRLFGVGASAGQIGQLVYDTIHPDFLEIARERIRKVIEERIAVPPSEQTLLRADGSLVDVEVMTLPFEYDGKPAALSIVHDLSERKNAERELRRVNTELEGRVQQRTTELSEANRSLESFSYTVAHDLRAPLRSISGFTSLLEEGNGQRLDDEGREFLGRIKSSAASMNMLIEGLLSLSRLGRAKLHLLQVDLSALAASTLHELRERDPARVVDGVVAPGVVATGDLHLLKSVLDNLIGNAWKFTSGKAQARIEFGSQAHQGGVAYFVRDDGAGFDPDYADKLFGTFQRLHTGEEFPGIGIGLASVKRIIENHGGKVWAEGAVGQGATFWFSLPEPAA